MARVVNGYTTFTASLANQVDDFKNGEEDAGQAGDHHEDGEDPFLGGSSDEAVHLVGAGLLFTFDQRGKVVTLVDVVEEVDEGGVHTYFEDQSENVGPPQASTLLARVQVEGSAVLAIFEPVFALPVVPVGHMHRHQERGAGDEDELQGPQPYVGHGEEVVVADVVAPGLSRVAFEVFLFITPHLLCGHHKHQDPEEEHDREPHLAEDCGVFVHSTEEALEECPVHDDVCSQSVFSSC